MSSSLFTSTAAKTSSVGPEKKVIPRWIPISLLALSTIALAVPIWLFQKGRKAARMDALAPPRRARAEVVNRFTPVAHSTPSISSTSKPAPIKDPPNIHAVDAFNPALYTAGAFGIATLLVGVGAVSTVYGVQRAFNVQDAQKFGEEMRRAILRRMPSLLERIHRHGEDEVESQFGEVESEEVKWNWPDAEMRLQQAFQQKGVAAWAATLVEEMKAESRIERSKRDQSQSGTSGEPR